MYCFFLLFFLSGTIFASVETGLEVFFSDKQYVAFLDKRIGLITNHTGVDRQMRSSVSLFKEHLHLAALFSPEHGILGQHYAWEPISNGKDGDIPVYSLHGETRRPKPDMLKGLDVLVYDIQCTGVRAYTYPTTLFYMMEEAAKTGIEMIVLDRPNPINGLIVDGPMLEDEWRSFIGYVNVPYCHGMTIGELAHFFNEEYKIGCKLRVIPMKGWTRSMSYRDTGLAWIPPSPNIPEPDTPLFYPATGILGELQLLNIGIGFTMPFKIVGAPWIDAPTFAEKLNGQKLPGVRFQPFYFRPFWGLYKGVDCQGVLIQIMDSKIYKPVAVLYLLLGMVKSLYPQEFSKRVAISEARKDLFCKANGTARILQILTNEKYAVWKLLEFHRAERTAFLEKRKKYLLY
jgi:uncharacterized protein YbbC (DUF1343 family)